LRAGHVGSSRARSSSVATDATSDPDGDIISHWWRAGRKPAGAKPVFGKPGARATEVTGLSVPGEYVFQLTVVDRTKSAQKEVIGNNDVWLLFGSLGNNETCPFCQNGGRRYFSPDCLLFQGAFDRFGLFMQWMHAGVERQSIPM